jgi:hypothetical protein
LTGVLHTQMLDLLAKYVCALDSGIQGRLDQNDDELFSTIPTGNILPSRALTQEISQRSKQYITRLMTERVIEAFEMVNIAHQKGDRQFLSRRTAEFPFERLLHVAAIE